VGRIEGGSNTNVVPGKVVLRLDRRMIPEEDAAAVEAEVRSLIEQAVAGAPACGWRSSACCWLTRCSRRRAMRRWWPAIQRHGQAVFGEPIPTSGTPLYTDVRLYGARGVPAVIYGAGPRTVLESNAKRADEHLELSDLRGATKVIARTLFDLSVELPNRVLPHGALCSQLVQAPAFGEHGTCRICSQVHLNPPPPNRSSR
jgi:succinyl-diaminopimelate desuccinylase